jgi:hypothetical protein
MDPRDTPDYRLHRALSNLTSIDGEQLEPADRERISTATALLEQAELLTRPNATSNRDANEES